MGKHLHFNKEGLNLDFSYLKERELHQFMSQCLFFLVLFDYVLGKKYSS